MRNDTITFAIEGTVGLDVFEDAVSAARTLVDELDDARHPDERVAWIVGPADGGLEGVQLRPCSGDRDRACKVASRVGTIAAAIVADVQIDAPANARKAAWALARLPARDGITAMIIAAGGTTHRISRLGRGSAMVPDAVKTEDWYVSGRVAELRTGGEPCMIVIDHEYDHPVCCYIDPEAAMPRPARVGDEVSVFGTVLRAPWFERPLEVRNVTKAEVELDPENAWKRARGAIKWKPGDEPAEVMIRRLRGGG